MLSWWETIATWTGFCEGDSCTDGAIPYLNLNDWFHYYQAVIATTPGTPQYEEPPSSNITDNDDNWDPLFSWPCTFDDPSTCWWDYGPPPDPSTSMSKRQLSIRATSPGALTLINGAHPVSFKVVGNSTSLAQGSSFRLGRGPKQPPNVPPPVYANGIRVPLRLHGYNTTDSTLGVRAIPPTPTVAAHDRGQYAHLNATRVKRAMITPSQCRGATDVPPILPTLTYFCNLLPNICANIRSHPDWPSTDVFILTHDPFTPKGTRRKQVCTENLKGEYQRIGKCDLRQHDPAYWKVRT